MTSPRKSKHDRVNSAKTDASLSVKRGRSLSDEEQQKDDNAVPTVQPMKKVRVDESETVQHVEDVVKSHGADDGGQIQQNDIAVRCAGATFGSVLERSPSESATVSTESDSASRARDDKQGSSGNLDGQTCQPLGDGVVYLEDLDTLVVQELPATCEVMDEDAQDEFLRAGYVNLPPLRQGSFLSWDPTEGPGHPMFSMYWMAVNRDIRIWNCVDALQFVQLDRIVNPSRVSPLVVNAKRSAPDGSKLRLHVGKTHAICVTAIAVTDSYLHSFPTSGLAQRQLRGIVHSQEWDRLVGFFCMAFHQPELGAQLYKDSLSFTTKTGQNNNVPKSSTQVDDTSMFRPSTKTKKVSVRSLTSKSDPFLLDVTDEIPVYDARNTDFNLQTDIESRNKLPVFEGEIPKRSFVVVGYTASVYRSTKGRKWNLSSNLLWAIVMGTPVGK